MDQIRIGVVGPGLIWKRAHKPALDLVGEQAAVTAFSASSERTRQEVAQAYPGVPFYFDYRDLVTSPEVNWVLVLTPIALNAPVALAALRAGKDVLMEKPMARTLEEGESLLRLANETCQRLYVLEQAVYPSYLDTVEALIHSGEVGDLLAYDVVQHELFDATPEHSVGGYGATAWRIQPDFPLGTLFDGGHHPIARLSRLFGRPEAVYASGHKVRPTYGEFDHVLMLFEYESGVQGSFSYSTVLSERRNYLHIRGTQGILSIERSRLVVDHNDGDQRTIAFTREPAYAAMWRAILSAIAEGREPYYTKERAFQDLSILFAIHRSTQSGAKVRV
jgi:predicted dehydrogenase